MRSRPRLSALNLLLPLRRPLLGLALLFGLMASACIPVFRAITVDELNFRGDSLGGRFSSPARAYLQDGSIIVLPEGGQVIQDRLLGDGMRYSLTLQDSVAFSSVAIDSIVAVEVVDTETVNELGTVLVAAASAAALVAGGVALAVAIFGSCPTIYADVAGEAVLQMEAFSFSIAPMFESRDLERLHTEPDSEGFVRLELRNEALASLVSSWSEPVVSGESACSSIPRACFL